MEKKSKIQKRVTIYDVAAAANVSASTASRALSNNGYPISKDTRKKIMDAAHKLAYTPNLLGRMLKTSDTKDIGVIIPNISNPFYPLLVLGIETEARKHGYNILLCNSFRDAATEKKYIESMYQKQVMGIILSTIREEQGFLKNLCINGLKVVAFDQNIEGLQCNKVSFDFTSGAIMAVGHLAKLGHRKIAFASAPLTRRSRREIFTGYKMGMVKCGLDVMDDLIYISEHEEELFAGTYEFENGAQIALRCIGSKNRPTAIFAVNDITAIGIMHGLVQKGFNVPEDVSVMGFDNIEMSKMVNPPLTTINQPAFETGRIACKILIDNITGDFDDIVSFKMEPTLVERKSTKRLE